MRYLWVLCILLSGCAGWQGATRHLRADADAGTRECAQMFLAMDRAVTLAGVVDGGPARVPGYPYFRATRFEVSLKDRLHDEAAWRQWFGLLRATDQTARHYENMNLPESVRMGDDAMDKLRHCGDRLAMLDVTQEAVRRELQRNVEVPPDYQTWKRGLGVYALTRIPFAAGVRGYQRDTEAVFRTPLEQLQVRGALVRYAWPAMSQLAAATVPSEGYGAANPLQLPQYTPQALAELLDRHAPQFEVDEVGEFDRIGRLVYTDKVQVDSVVPTLYQRVAYTRYGDRTLLQLVYGIWFPARPEKGVFDLLGGNLDGLYWRVTLDSEGHALLYDSIHPCGCYHQFFPTARATLKPRPDSLDEYAFVPQVAPSAAPSQRLVVRIASGTHYIQRVYLSQNGDAGTAQTAVAASRPYAFAQDDDLRSLPATRDRRSAFRPDGIVAGSERGERYLFWPMGVASPGAMRQYGRHATAFIGRRHFDDARLIERYFDLDLQK